MFFHRTSYLVRCALFNLSSLKCKYFISFVFSDLIHVIYRAPNFLKYFIYIYTPSTEFLNVGRSKDLWDNYKNKIKNNISIIIFCTLIIRASKTVKSRKLFVIHSPPLYCAVVVEKYVIFLADLFG